MSNDDDIATELSNVLGRSSTCDLRYETQLPIQDLGSEHLRQMSKRRQAHQDEYVIGESRTTCFLGRGSAVRRWL